MSQKNKYKPMTLDAEESTPVAGKTVLEDSVVEQIETPTVETEVPELKKEIPQWIKLQVFATIAGPKWDQMAGFVSYALAKKMPSMTMAEWQQELEKFLNRPVG